MAINSERSDNVIEQQGEERRKSTDPRVFKDVAGAEAGTEMQSQSERVQKVSQFLMDAFSQVFNPSEFRQTDLAVVAKMFDDIAEFVLAFQATATESKLLEILESKFDQNSLTRLIGFMNAGGLARVQEVVPEEMQKRFLDKMKGLNAAIAPAALQMSDTDFLQYYFLTYIQPKKKFRDIDEENAAMAKFVIANDRMTAVAALKQAVAFMEGNYSITALSRVMLTKRGAEGNVFWASAKELPLAPGRMWTDVMNWWKSRHFFSFA